MSDGVVSASATVATESSAFAEQVIVSEANPEGAGGVSSALAQLQRKYQQEGKKIGWVNRTPAGWRMDGATTIGQSPRFSNEILLRARSLGAQWLWLVLHDMASRGRLQNPDLVAYETVNQRVARFVAEQLQHSATPAVFLQDYQCALMATGIRRLRPQARLSLFLHTPFPAAVEDEDMMGMQRIVRGMLGNDVIGFHTQEYADNFLDFVEMHMTELNGNRMYTGGPRITRTPRTKAIAMEDGRHVRLLVAPIGLDSAMWAQRASSTEELPAAIQKKIGSAEILILSADRLDPTKGEVDRLTAIRRFLWDHTEYHEKILFAQAGSHSRQGFQTYEAEKRRVDEAWQGIKRDFFHRMTTYLGNVPPEHLAKLYRRARVMIVNPWHDGWNLTAAEYVACQDMVDPGVLLLSPGAGCFTQFHEGVLSVSPHNATRFAEVIHQALVMDLGERRRRMQILQTANAGNTLEDWVRAISAGSQAA